MKLLDEGDAFAATTTGRLADEALVWEVSHVLLQVFDLVREQERVGHESVVDGEEALQTTDNDTEDVLLSEVIHQRVAVDERTLHFDQLDIAVSEGNSVVQNVSIRLVARLSVAILANDILHSVDFAPAVVRVHNDVASAAVRRLHDAHDLRRALCGHGMRGPVLLFAFLVITVGPLAILMVMCLLALAALLLWSDHGRDDVVVRASVSIALFAVGLGVRAHFLGCLTCARIRVGRTGHCAWH